jgi:integrase/recombinase XerC
VSTELVPIPVPSFPPKPGLPAVRAIDLYDALLADARKPTTRWARVQDIVDLARFLRIPDPSTACARFIAGGGPQANAIATAYIRSMLDKELAPATINRRVSTLRRLCKLAWRFDVITWSAIAVDSLRVESYRDTTGPGRDGWLRILEVASRLARKTAKGKRDLSLIRLLHDQGLRRAEVSGLDLADLDIGEKRLRVLGKGKGEKSPIRLNKPTVLALARWLDARGRDPGPLFIRLDRARPKGELARLDGDSILNAVTALGRQAGLSQRVRAHGLRHEAVTRILALTNGNIDSAQKFARHADPKTTQRYNDNRLDIAGEMAELLGEDL